MSNKILQNISIKRNMKPEQDFEQYWKENRDRILQNDEEYKRAKDNLKMTSGADWLLFAIPIVGAILFMDWVPIQKELLKWVTSAGVAILLFVVCVWIKSLSTENSNPEEIEEKIKQKAREHFRLNHEP
ncbi:MAG TPA: hypothetical protein DIS88_10710 [Prevotella sp.]|nr:hypothetical protein [Prevotella sp.]